MYTSVTCCIAVWLSQDSDLHIRDVADVVTLVLQFARFARYTLDLAGK